MGGRGGSFNAGGGFSDAEKTDLMELYVSEEGFAMNAFARGESIDKWKRAGMTEEEIADYTERMTEMLENEKLEKDTRVYRGATFDSIVASTGLTEAQIRENPEALIGKTIIEKGFMSTTSSYRSAEEYANGNVVMRIDLPKGAKAVNQSKYNQYLDTSEITVQRNSKVKVNYAYETQDERGRKITLIQGTYVDAGKKKK